MLMTESKLRQIISDEIGKRNTKRMMEQAVPPGGTSPFPLRNGSRGPEVKSLQEKIGAGADGIFGPETENKLIDATGAATIDEAEYNELLGLEPAEGEEEEVDAGDPQVGNLGPAEVQHLNGALAAVADPSIPENYKKPESADLRDFWPAWAQFLMLHYEPKTIDQETDAKFEGVLDPKVIYAQWDDVAAEQLGYTPDKVGAIQFIENGGAPLAGSPMAEIMGIGVEEEVDILDPDTVTAFISEYGGKVDTMQDDYMSFPVSQGNMTSAGKLFGEIVAGDDENLSNSRMFAALYAIRNTSWKEGLSDIIGGAVIALPLMFVGPLAGVLGTTGAALGTGTAAVGTTAASSGALAGGAAAAGATAGAGSAGLFSRSITSWIRDGYEEEAAVVNAIAEADIEMAEDIGRTSWMSDSSSGAQIAAGLESMITSMITKGDGYKKSDAMADLGRLPGGLVSESARLTSIIDQLILEITMGVADADIAPYGSLPFDPSAVEEEGEVGADLEPVRRAGTGTGTGGRGEAATAPAAGAAGGRAAVVQARQQGRTDRTGIRQGERSGRAAQRQDARAERRDQRGERQAARGDRRANRRAARAERRAARQGE